MRDTTAKGLSWVHRVLYQRTSGKLGKRFVKNDMLLLTTTGRRSGRSHTVPLLYLEDRPDLLVIASWGGRDYPPDWYANLTAHPAVGVQVDGSRHAAMAAALSEPERARWWDRFVAAYDGYTAYQGRTDRVIPIIRLSPEQDAAQGPDGIATSPAG